MATSRTDQWEYCQIERLVARVHWWSRRRVGAFVAVHRGAGPERTFARSGSFPAPAREDEDLAALDAFRRQLISEGWEQWRAPEVTLGPQIFKTGYWHYTLRRTLQVERAEAKEERPPGIPVTAEWEAEPPPFFTLPPAMVPPSSPGRARRWG